MCVTDSVSGHNCCCPSRNACPPGLHVRAVGCSPRPCGLAAAQRGGRSVLQVWACAGEGAQRPRPGAHLPCTAAPGQGPGFGSGSRWFLVCVFRVLGGLCAVLGRQPSWPEPWAPIGPVCWGLGGGFRSMRSARPVLDAAPVGVPWGGYLAVPRAQPSGVSPASQGVERPLQPLARPARPHGQQRQQGHALQHGVHLLRALRPPGGRRRPE